MRSIYLLYCLTLGLLALDSYFYPGFVKSQILLDSRLIMFGFIALLLWMRLKSRFIFSVWLGRLSGIAAIILFTLTLALTFSEISHYPNYVFTTYHLHYDHISYLFVTLLTAWLGAKSINFYTTNKNMILLVLPFMIWGYGLLMRTWPMDFFLINIQEDQLAEKVQVTLYAISTIIMVYSSTWLWSKNRMLAIILWGLSLGLFFVTGEEISWGQRILGISTPEYIAVTNTQGEITLHNNQNIIGYVDILYIVLGIIGASSWYFVKSFKNNMEIVAYIIPPKYLSFFYLLPSIFIWHDQYVSRQYKDWREYFELILSIGIVSSCIVIYHRIKKIK